MTAAEAVKWIERHSFKDPGVDLQATIARLFSPSQGKAIETLLIRIRFRVFRDINSGRPWRDNEGVEMTTQLDPQLFELAPDQEGLLRNSIEQLWMSMMEHEYEEQLHFDGEPVEVAHL